MACGPKFKNLYYCSRLYFYRRSHSLYSKNRHRKHGYSGYDVLPKVYLSGSGQWRRLVPLVDNLLLGHVDRLRPSHRDFPHPPLLRQNRAAILASEFGGPAIFGIIWFTIFGGTAIHMQLENIFDLWSVFQDKGLESAAFSFFQQLPLGTILVFVFLVVIVISFVTMADSMTSVASIMSTKGFQHEDGEPPTVLKVVWALP